jgi:hypothetical protein
MGLDILAYRGLTKAPEAELDKDGYPVEYNKFHVFDASTITGTEREWPGRTEGVEPGVYSAADSFGFRAGSYGGYNSWRDWLARISGWGSAKACWNSRKTGDPFYELINFSDCEGIIGPRVAAKLAKDFADHAIKAKALSAEDDTYYFEKYGDWQKAFEMAADNGAVSFH